MLRRTPLTSTLANDCSASTISTTWPGIPRHIVVLLSQLSADARQWIADEHVDDPAAAERSPQCHNPLRVRHDLADDRRVGALRVRPQGCNGCFSLIGCDDREELALVRD